MIPYEIILYNFLKNVKYKLKNYDEFIKNPGLFREN